MDARRMGTLAAFAALSIATLLILALLATAALTFLQGDQYRERFEGLVSEQLNAELHLDGSLSLQLLPRPGVVATDLVLKQNGNDIGHAEQVRIELSWRSLLRRQLIVERVHLQAPHLALQRAQDGSLNLHMRQQDEAGAVDENMASATDVSVGQLRIEDGHLELTQQSRSGSHSLALEEAALTLKHFRIAAGDAPLPQRLAFNGELSAAHLRVNQLAITNLQATLDASEGQPAVIAVAGALFDGQLDGELTADYTRSTPSLHADVTLSGFTLQAFLRQLAADLNAAGELDFTAQLSSEPNSHGGGWHTLEGQLTLRGEQLHLHGLDIDAELARYQSTQRFNLVDLGALVFAGPAGIAATKGAGFARLLDRSGGETVIRQLISRWSISQGIARAEDVALATEHNRLVLLGELDLHQRRFSGSEVAVVDHQGCAIIRQGISGTFAEPEIEAVNYVKALLGAPLDLLRQGLSLVDIKQPCDPVYHGSIASP